MIQLKYSDLKKVRAEIHKRQDFICPILKQKFETKAMVVDHQHKRKDDPIGVNGDGLVRGCIHNRANVIEGKIVSAYKRYGLNKFLPLPDLLRNIADYLEQENLPLIHPTEKKKPKKLTKRSYNALKRVYTGRSKFPIYPKSGLLTKPLKKLFEDFSVEPEFYA